METKNEIVTFEQATSLTGKKAIDFFSDAENIYPLIEQVKKEALSLVPNVETKKGRDEIGSTALKVSKSRKALTEAIDKSVADLKAKVQKAGEVKKLVTTELNDTREQVLRPRNEWQAEQDRIEAERVSEIKSRIANIESIGVYALDETKEELAHRIDSLEAMDVSEGFAEFTADAAQAIASATKSLNDRILQIVEEEKSEAQRKQLEAEQKKNRIQERLTNLVQIPLGLMGKSSTEIQNKIDSLVNFEIKKEDFDDRAGEAKTSLDQVVSQLNMMLTQAKMLEEAQAKAPVKEDEITQGTQAYQELMTTTEPNLISEEEEAIFNDCVADAKPADSSIPCVVSVHVKVTDRGCYDFKDSGGNTLASLDGEYVPDFFPGEHYGDYLILDIELETGRIINWRFPTKSQIEEAMSV